MTDRVYIDLIFLVNGVMNGIVLAVLNKLLEKRAGLGRILFGAGLGGLWACAVALFPQMPGFARMIGTDLAAAVLMTAVVFRPAGIRELAGELAGLYLVSGLTAGVLAALYQHTRAGWYMELLAAGEGRAAFPLFIWMLMAAAGGVGAWGLGKAAARSLKNRIQGRRFCHVTLGFQENTVRVRGLLDTGNCLREPFSGRPVHVADAQVMLRLCPRVSQVFYVPFRAVGTERGLLPAVSIDWMEVELGGESRRFNHPLIAVSKEDVSVQGSYQILLQQEQWEEMTQHTGGKKHDDQSIHTKPFSIKNHAGISDRADAKAERGPLHRGSRYSACAPGGDPGGPDDRAFRRG